MYPTASRLLQAMLAERLPPRIDRSVPVFPQPVSIIRLNLGEPGNGKCLSAGFRNRFGLPAKAKDGCELPSDLNPAQAVVGLAISSSTSSTAILPPLDSVAIRVTAAFRSRKFAVLWAVGDSEKFQEPVAGLLIHRHIPARLGLKSVQFIPIRLGSMSSRR
jgi:hypothetical protein